MCCWRDAAPCFLGPGSGSHGYFEAVSVRLGILSGLGLSCDPLFFVSACLDGRCLPSLAVEAVRSGSIVGSLSLSVGFGDGSPIGSFFGLSSCEGVSTDFLGRSSVSSVLAGLGKSYPLYPLSIGLFTIGAGLTLCC